MFGYVRPNLTALTPDEQQRYRAHYCGLCRALGKRHGPAGQIALNFDLTFLTIFLASLYEPAETAGQARCVPHPAKEHPWAASSVTDYAADMTIALTWHKCRDDWQDDRSLPARGYMQLLKKRYAAVKALWPRQCQAIEDALQELGDVEARRDETPDAAPHAFGQLMAELFVMQEDYWAGALRRFGYSLGQFVYMIDAVCDFDKDAKSGSYNPVILMGKAPEGMRETLELLLGGASAVFEQLPLIQDEGILRNILYSGLWQGYNEYLEKKRRKAEKAAAKRASDDVKEVDGHGE